MADNDRTWTTATWLVAVAWALFPATLAFRTALTPAVDVPFGLTSTALMLLWLLIGWTHALWASRSYDIVRAIEIHFLGAEQDEEVRESLRTAHPVLAEGALMKAVRVVMVAGTLVAWVVLFIRTSQGAITFPPGT